MFHLSTNLAHHTPTTLMCATLSLLSTNLLQWTTPINALKPAVKNKEVQNSTHAFTINTVWRDHTMQTQQDSQKAITTWLVEQIQAVECHLQRWVEGSCCDISEISQTTLVPPSNHTDNTHAYMCLLRFSVHVLHDDRSLSVGWDTRSVMNLLPFKTTTIKA